MIMIHSRFPEAGCWVTVRITVVMLVAGSNTVWLVIVTCVSPSHLRPYCDVNAMRNAFVTTPTRFRNSKMAYHIPRKFDRYFGDLIPSASNTIFDCDAQVAKTGKE